VKLNQMKKRILFIGFIALLFHACAPATAQPTPRPTVTVTPTKPCTEQGTIGSDHVANPTQGFDNIHFEYYLPPCYDSAKQTRYPVFYLMTLTNEHSLSPTDNTPMSLAERLIRAGKMPPTIIIVPAQLIGYGSDAALTKDLVPYVDGKFRTIRDRKQRATGGISNGAAVAVRMAFQFPDTFSSVGLLSGGLADGERERFEGWITRTPPDHWPRVRIDVGDHDGIMPLTQNLLTALDKHHVPYTLNIGKGDHNWTFWSAQMESYLLWLSNGG
jgi:enterochelin esterase-like enzyme